MRLRAAALGLLALTLAACATQATRPSNEEDVAAILAFNQRYVKSINDGDIATLSSLTTQEHVMIPSGGTPLVGKAANDAANGRAFEQFRFAEAWTPIETIIAGDWAFQRGTFTVQATPKAGGAARDLAGHYLHVYRRQPDGQWRMVRDMFTTNNTNRPLQSN